MNDRFFNRDLSDGFRNSGHWPSRYSEFSDEFLLTDWNAVLAELELAEGDLDPLDDPVTEKPHAVWVPEQYEPNYAYPLIVWFHSDGRDERELLDVLPQISRKNYFGLALRGPLPSCSEAGAGFRWSLADHRPVDALCEVYETVCQMRRMYHIHSERIYLAGADTGATLAVRLLLERPDWFGGAINLGGDFPDVRQPFHRSEELHGKRILLSAGSRNRQIRIGETVESARLLHAAGMQVATRIYDAGQQITPKMMRDIDRWLMDALCETSLA